MATARDAGQVLPTHDVCAAHIALYVNRHSLDIGDDGLRAIARLAG